MVTWDFFVALTPKGTSRASRDQDPTVAVATCMACGRMELYALDPAAVAAQSDAVMVEVSGGGPYR
jgi:hypothetical protein